MNVYGEIQLTSALSMADYDKILFLFAENTRNRLSESQFVFSLFFKY
jgi:hypothetical protein